MIKKIVFTVTPIFSIPPRGAAAVEMWIYQVAKRLSISNTIACIRNDGYPEYAEINSGSNIYYIGFSRLYKRIFQKWTRLDPLPYSQRILNVAEKEATQADRVTIIHNSMKLYRQIRKRSPNENLVMHMHNAFEPNGLDHNAKIIVPSQFLKDFYVSRMPNADVCIVSNGFCSDTYLDIQTSQVRHQLNISNDEIVLLYAGRISPDKGCLELMQAFREMHAENSKLRLVVVGDPFASRKGEKAEYQKKVIATAAAIGSACILVGGKPPEEMHSYYSMAELVIVPSLVEEAFCMVAAEAMAAGKPVLASQKGGIREFVLHGETGYHLSEPISKESLIADIFETLADEDKSRIAMAAREYVFNKYSWEQVAQCFEKQIEIWFE